MTAFDADAILLIAHGTRDPLGNEETLRLAALVEAQAGIPVRTGFIEHAEPDVPETIDAMIAEGLRRIVAAPVILIAAGHVKEDVPQFIEAARRRHPDASFRVADNLGIHPSILDILDERLRSCEADVAEVARENTSVVFVGRGSSDPDANSDIYKISRLFWESRGFRSVHVGFIGVTYPTMQESLQQASRMAPARIIVLPYFLFMGLLLTRIEKITDEAKALYPGCEVLQAKHMGPDIRLAEVILDRCRQNSAPALADPSDLMVSRP